MSHIEDLVLVALDLETTGLDPQHDRIIEVGAVRFRTDGTILAEFQQLVNPGRGLAYRISQLTGIDNTMLQDAPPWEVVRPQLAEFVGDAAVVGHNVQFDLSFLASHGLTLAGQPLDTFDLATMLLPGLRRYNLGFLAHVLGVPLVDAHRALDDARATARIFVALLERGVMLPWPVHQAIARLARDRRWPYAPFFAWMREEHRRRKLRRKEDVRPLRPRTDVTLPFAPPPSAPVLTPRETPDPIPVDTLSTLLEPEGPLARVMPGYEHRPQQVHMLREVARALNEGHHLLVEAGTGTGKSLAYLIPAAYFAHHNQERVLIATHTINLQDQLFQKDLPVLQQLVPFPVYATVLKGRHNYLCVRRLREFMERKDLSPAAVTFAAKLLVWLAHTGTGDVAELGLSQEEQRVFWPQVASDPNTCTRERCLEAGDFYYLARDRAERSHLVIVNHALLLADVSVENRALPPFNHLIIDEGHHLEEAVTQQLGYRVSAQDMHQTLFAIHNPHAPRSHGLLTRVQACTRPLEIGPERAAEFGSLANQIADHIRQLEPLLRRFWQDVARFVKEHGLQEQGGYDRRLRLTPTERLQPAWSHVEISWERCVPRWEELIATLGRLASRLELYASHLMHEDMAQASLDVRGAVTRLQEMVHQVTRFVTSPLDDYVYWLEEAAEKGVITLHAAPLHVGSLVRQHLWERKRAIVMTSATLRTGDSFDYLRERLSAWEAEELSLGSPYDYVSSTLLYIPTDIPEPNRPGYQRMVEEALIALAQATRGRMLVLFTSYSQLRRTAEAIGPVLQQAGIVVYEQGMGGRTQVLENFRTTEQAVLLGTRSFWEGVDIPGEALSVLVIARLPFSVPSDPVIQARAETYEDPFREYQVPQAILRFRQGFGRLIRSSTDRGVVVILDRRVDTKMYGRLFLDALPPCTVQRAPLSHLPQAARHWLDEARSPLAHRVE